MDFRKRPTLLAAVIVIAFLLARGPAVAAEFLLAFEGCPAELSGLPGEVRTFEVLATLTTSNNESPYGAQGWGLLVDPGVGTVRDFSVKDLHVSTIFDHDQNPDTPLVDPYDLLLSDASFAKRNLGGCGPKVDGHNVVLNYTKLMVLQPEGTQPIARVIIEVAIPAEEGLLELSFFDGNDLPPDHQYHDIRSVITHEGASLPAARQNCLIPLRPVAEPGFRRGDANADATVDITDAIFTFGFLFLGETTAPCRDAADTNDDGRVDISDGIFLLAHLFLQSATSAIPPPGPFQCGSDWTADGTGCAASPACP